MLAIVNLALSILPSKPSYFLASSLTLGKVYSNSMMAVLNGRMRINETEHAASANTGSNSSTTVVRYRNGVVSHGGPESYEMGGEGIKITREEIVFPDNSEVPKGAHSQTKVFLNIE